ncbi:MAG: putative drug resistance transporter, ATPase subunit, partial [Ilumatobacteraceae bacterium]|nr:putative drug resistance transporter, ATPase subunit [Ilumatobacteraceae bacterium]
ALADSIVLIDHGRAVASGTPTELKARIGDQRVDIVAMDRDGLDQLVAGLEQQFDVTVSHENRTVSVPAPLGTADLGRITAAVQATGTPVDEVALRRPTLDDAFLTFTGQPTTHDAELAS